MTQLTVREAADKVGVTRQTIFKYIRQGKLSATLSRDGQKQIDVSELIRVFGELQQVTETTGQVSAAAGEIARVAAHRTRARGDLPLRVDAVVRGQTALPARVVYGRRLQDGSRRGDGDDGAPLASAGALRDGAGARTPAVGL